MESEDRIRTGLGAAAGISFDEGTVLQLGPDASFVVEEASEKAMRTRLDLGLLRANVQPQAAGKFELRTPTALLRVRGTDFEVRVLAGGRTLVELYQGALAVEDNLGNQTLLKPNERLQIDVRGLQAPELRPSRQQTASAGVRALARGEAALDASQERERAATDRELKLAEFQQGRALVDVTGSRVRVEEYILRPSADSFRLVVLNERGRSMNWFFYQGTFNRSLPGDLTAPLSQLSGCADRQCDWFLTEYTTGRSNLVDNVLERGVNTLGGQIDVNSNGSVNDDVSTVFDGASDRFINVAGRPVFQTIFNKFGLYVNGKLLIGKSGGNNITSDQDRLPSSVTDPITGAALTDANAWLDSTNGQLVTLAADVKTSSAEKGHQQVYNSFSDGSHIQWDNYSLNLDGKVVPRGELGGVAGDPFRRGVLNFGYEQVITSSHFQGRRIDLLVQPRILVQAGILQQ
ncbi:MAG: FecR domain-containing protein [Elusimicrobia bacterium]|nr:FecR domain-containing protein [Elusimicrobiota bacterium]